MSKRTTVSCINHKYIMHNNLSSDRNNQNNDLVRRSKNNNENLAPRKSVNIMYDKNNNDSNEDDRSGTSELIIFSKSSNLSSQIQMMTTTTATTTRNGYCVLNASLNYCCPCRHLCDSGVHHQCESRATIINVKSSNKMCHNDNANQWVGDYDDAINRKRTTSYDSNSRSHNDCQQRHQQRERHQIQGKRRVKSKKRNNKSNSFSIDDLHEEINRKNGYEDCKDKLTGFSKSVGLSLSKAQNNHQIRSSSIRISISNSLIVFILTLVLLSSSGHFDLNRRRKQRDNHNSATNGSSHSSSSTSSSSSSASSEDADRMDDVNNVRNNGDGSNGRSHFKYQNLNHIINIVMCLEAPMPHTSSTDAHDSQNVHKPVNSSNAGQATKTMNDNNNKNESQSIHAAHKTTVMTNLQESTPIKGKESPTANHSSSLLNKTSDSLISSLSASSSLSPAASASTSASASLRRNDMDTTQVAEDRQRPVMIWPAAALHEDEITSKDILQQPHLSLTSDIGGKLPSPIRLPSLLSTGSHVHMLMKQTYLNGAKRLKSKKSLPFYNHPHHYYDHHNHLPILVNDIYLPNNIVHPSHHDHNDGDHHHNPQQSTSYPTIIDQLKPITGMATSNNVVRMRYHQPPPSIHDHEDHLHTSYSHPHSPHRYSSHSHVHGHPHNHHHNDDDDHQHHPTASSNSIDSSSSVVPVEIIGLDPFHSSTEEPLIGQLGHLDRGQTRLRGPNVNLKHAQPVPVIGTQTTSIHHIHSFQPHPSVLVKERQQQKKRGYHRHLIHNYKHGPGGGDGGAIVVYHNHKDKHSTHHGGDEIIEKHYLAPATTATLTTTGTVVSNRNKQQQQTLNNNIAGETGSPIQEEQSTPADQPPQLVANTDVIEDDQFNPVNNRPQQDLNGDTVLALNDEDKQQQQQQQQSSEQQQQVVEEVIQYVQQPGGEPIPQNEVQQQSKSHRQQQQQIIYGGLNPQSQETIMTDDPNQSPISVIQVSDAGEEEQQSQAQPDQGINNQNNVAYKQQQTPTNQQADPIPSYPIMQSAGGGGEGDSAKLININDSISNNLVRPNNLMTNEHSTEVSSTKQMPMRQQQTMNYANLQQILQANNPRQLALSNIRQLILNGQQLPPSQQQQQPQSNNNNPQLPPLDPMQLVLPQVVNGPYLAPPIGRGPMDMARQQQLMGSLLINNNANYQPSSSNINEQQQQDQQQYLGPSLIANQQQPILIDHHLHQRLATKPLNMTIQPPINSNQTTLPNQQYIDDGSLLYPSSGLHRVPVPLTHDQTKFNTTDLASRLIMNDRLIREQQQRLWDWQQRFQSLASPENYAVAGNNHDSGNTVRGSMLMNNVTNGLQQSSNNSIGAPVLDGSQQTTSKEVSGGDHLVQLHGLKFQSESNPPMKQYDASSHEINGGIFLAGVATNSGEPSSTHQPINNNNQSTSTSGGSVDDKQQLTISPTNIMENASRQHQQQFGNMPLSDILRPHQLFGDPGSEHSLPPFSTHVPHFFNNQRIIHNYSLLRQINNLNQQHKRQMDHLPPNVTVSTPLGGIFNILGATTQTIEPSSSPRFQLAMGLLQNPQNRIHQMINEAPHQPSSSNNNHQILYNTPAQIVTTTLLPTMTHSNSRIYPNQHQQHPYDLAKSNQLHSTVVPPVVASTIDTIQQGDQVDSTAKSTINMFRSKNSNENTADPHQNINSTNDGKKTFNLSKYPGYRGHPESVHKANNDESKHSLSIGRHNQFNISNQSGVNNNSDSSSTSLEDGDAEPSLGGFSIFIIILFLFLSFVTMIGFIVHKSIRRAGGRTSTLTRRPRLVLSRPSVSGANFTRSSNRLSPRSNNDNNSRSCFRPLTALRRSDERILAPSTTPKAPIHQPSPASVSTFAPTNQPKPQSNQMKNLISIKSMSDSGKPIMNNLSTINNDVTTLSSINNLHQKSSPITRQPCAIHGWVSSFKPITSSPLNPAGTTTTTTTTTNLSTAMGISNNNLNQMVNPSSGKANQKMVQPITKSTVVNGGGLSTRPFDTS